MGEHRASARYDLDLNAAANAKQHIRERVWNRLERQGVVPMPAGAHGRIPNFIGAHDAAMQLARLQDWHATRTVKANPDKAQGEARRRALRDGKRVHMAVPRLAGRLPFVLLDPAELGGRLDAAMTHELASSLGRKVSISEMEPIDLVVCGSVAVNRDGARIGKGGGFLDIEVALLVEAGLATERTTIATTVHELQMVDEPLPETDHDFRVDWILTPSEAIRCQRTRYCPGSFGIT